MLFRNLLYPFKILKRIDSMDVIDGLVGECLGNDPHLSFNVLKNDPRPVCFGDLQLKLTSDPMLHQPDIDERQR